MNEGIRDRGSGIGIGRKPRTIELAKLALTSFKEVQKLARTGELSKDELWVAARGAERFLHAAASGDVADIAETRRRLSVCRVCPSRVRSKLPEADSASDWCGPALRPLAQGASLSIEGVEVNGPTCGCLLAAKAVVGSEHCDQARW